MQRLLTLVLFVVVACGSFWAGLLVRSGPKLELSDAFARGGNWTRLRECLEPIDSERKTYEFAVSVLEHASANNQAGWLAIGAAKTLASGVYRSESGRVCAPSDTYLRVFNALEANNDLLKGRPVDWTLELIDQLPRYSEHFARWVGASAFSPYPQENEAGNLSRDLRPMARSVLANMRALALPWREQAFSEISAKDALGTGAAQVAMAAGHPEAVQRILTLIDGLLLSVPPDKAIPWEKRHRLHELAYAVTFSKDAPKHVDKIKTIMHRKVQSWAPPFGMVELDPVEMCTILRLIEGNQSTSAQQFVYCNDRK